MSNNPKFKSALLVPVGNPSKLAEAICSVISNPDAAKQRAKYAQSQVDNMTVQAAFRAYQAIYEEALNK